MVSAPGIPFPHSRSSLPALRTPLAGRSPLLPRSCMLSHSLGLSVGLDEREKSVLAVLSDYDAVRTRHGTKGNQSHPAAERCRQAQRGGIQEVPRARCRYGGTRIHVQRVLTPTSGLSYDDREEYANNSNSAMDIDTLDLNPIPPGEEGVLASHAGGEEEMCRELFKSKRCVHLSSDVFQPHTVMMAGTMDAHGGIGRRAGMKPGRRRFPPSRRRSWVGNDERPPGRLWTRQRRTTAHGRCFSSTSLVSIFVITFIPLSLQLEALCRVFYHLAHSIHTHGDRECHPRHTWVSRQRPSVSRPGLLVPDTRNLPGLPRRVSASEYPGFLSRACGSALGEYVS